MILVVTFVTLAICRNKWHPETFEISTPLEVAIETHLHVEHGTKTTLELIPSDGEASWLLFPSSGSILSGGTEQPENSYSGILKVTGLVWESHKSITLIIATISIPLSKSVSTDWMIQIQF